jgi:hypothetical protein
VFSGVYHPSLSLVNHASMRPIEEALYRILDRAPRTFDSYFAELAA